MAINKDNVLDVSWNNESLLQIRTALQELLTALGDSIDAAAGGNPASINLSVEGTVLTATVTLADGETELSESINLATMGFLTQHQSLKTVNGKSITGSGDVDVVHPVVIYNTAPMQFDDTLPIGTVYFDGVLYKVTANGPESVGQMRKDVVYFSQTDGAFYRWNDAWVKVMEMPDISALTNLISSKANAADVPGVIEGNVSVEQPANPNGTFTIHVGDNDYTVNLNHTHEGMAKVEKHTPSTLPDAEDMDDDTIYAEVEDGEVSVLYIGGVPFYGGVPSSDPVLRQPADESTIDVGKIASGSSSVTKTITVKGKNLTEALSVVVTGTGFTVDKQSIPAVDANLGTTLTITCTSTDDNAAGTLTIASNEVSCDCDLVANVPVITPLTAIKLTGSQWLQTDYCPGPNTEFDFDIGFANVPAAGTDVSSLGRVVMSCPLNTTTDTNKVFRLVINGNTRDFVFTNEESSSQYDNTPQSVVAPKTDGRGIFGYRIGQNNGIISFGDGQDATSLKTTTMQSPIMIGYGRATSSGTDSIFTYCHLIIYGFVITENGETVRNYVPATRNGVPGLHDTKTGAFISSETSTQVVEIE